MNLVHSGYGCLNASLKECYSEEGKSNSRGIVIKKYMKHNANLFISSLTTNISILIQFLSSDLFCPFLNPIDLLSKSPDFDVTTTLGCHVLTTIDINIID